MRVVDIYPEAAEYLGTNDQTHVFRVCTRATEYLAAKGDWDVLKGYVDLPIQNSNFVVLPWQVETPLKFTINNIPAFSKDRLYEFSLNGFGSAPGSDEMLYSWEDRGFVPTLLVPPANGFRLALPPSAADEGKKVVVQGMTTVNTEVKETMVIDEVNWAISAYHYGKLTEINKDITQGNVNLYYIQPPPPNDNFAQAQVLSGEDYNPTSPIRGTTVNATLEPGEPVTTNTATNTVWYKWTGVDTGENAIFWTFTTHLIEVFTGTMLSDLVLLTTSTVQQGVSAAIFVQNTGTTYWLRVSPVDFAGTFPLYWISAPQPGQLPGIPAEPALPVPIPPPQPIPPTGTVLIAQYFPQETNPRYRMIRISKVGVTARFLFRRKVFQIMSMDDFIPIQSQLGFLTMVQAIQALRRKDLETAKALADAAVEITTDAQRSTTGFIELANNTESQAARDYNIYNRDSVIMLDIFDDVAKILGNVGQFNIFDATTVALEALCAKGHYDGLTGYVDIQTDGRRYATLPRFVDQPVAISINGRPAYMRNKWSEFHLNGPGSDEYGGQWMGGGSFGSWYGFSGSGRWGQIHAWDSVGEVVTISPLSCVSQLVAIPDSVNDDGKTLRIYGYDETGKRILGADGQDGYTVVVNHNKLVPNINSDQKIARIDRITRDVTSNFVRLYAFDAAQQTTSVLLGYYYPDETEPKYFRIKLPLDAHWIRLRYRKRTYKVTSVWQPLHLHCRLAIVTMVRSMKALETDAAAAQVFEDKAMKFLDDDQKARNPGETFQLQFNEDCGWNSNFIVS